MLYCSVQYEVKEKVRNLGIRAFKAPLGRLRLHLPADAKIIYELLQIFVHLYNVVRVLGFKQIKTFYGNPTDNQHLWSERPHQQRIAC